MEFLVSVVIVTYNRPIECRNVINSLLLQSSLPFEILVIDDASTIPFTFNHPLVKIVRNPSEMGLSASRNIGVKISQGDIVAFIDDDAIAHKDWIKAINYAFQDYKTDICGGPVLPLFLLPPPKWFDVRHFGTYIGVNQHYNNESNIIGCNFAVKKSVFEKIGYFNENFGRKHGKLLSGEEIEFFQRAKDAKMRIIFAIGPKVYHIVYPHRLKMSYLMRRAWWEGKTCYHYLAISHASSYQELLKILLRRIGNALFSFVRIFLLTRYAHRWILTIIFQTSFTIAALKGHMHTRGNA